VAIWWNTFGDPWRPDDFHLATQHVVGGLAEGPSRGGGRTGPPFAVDTASRRAALEAAGFTEIADELLRWDLTLDAAGVRALYATFSPILLLREADRERALDGVARVAAEEFGGSVTRPCVTAIYTARTTRA